MPARLRTAAYALLVGGLTVAFPSPAGGQTVVADRFAPVTDIGLAGTGLVWIAPRRDGGYVVRFAPTGGRSRPIYLRRGEIGMALSAYLSASSTRILIEEYRQRVSSKPTDTGVPELTVLSAPLGGSFARVSGREISGGAQGTDLSGEAAIYPAPTGTGATIRDLSATPMARERSLPDAEGIYRIAGRLAAWVQDAQIVVYDWVAGRELYRVQDRRALPVRNSLGLDLQADGKVAVAYSVRSGRGERMAVGWSSPESPSLHALPLPASERYAVRLANDRISFIRGRLYGITVNGELGVTTLQGDSRILARGALDFFSGNSFDFDGQKVAWIARGCSAMQVRSLSIDRPPALRNPPRCRLRLRGRVSVGRGVRLSLDCAGFERRCRAADPKVITAARYRIGQRVFPAGTRVAVRLGVHSAGRLSLRLTPAGRQILSRGARVRVIVSATLRDGLDRRGDRRRRHLVLGGTGR